MDSHYNSNYVKVEKINNGYLIFISLKNISENKLRRDLDNIISNIFRKNANNDFGININTENKKLLEIQEKNLGEKYKGHLFVIDYLYYTFLPFPKVEIYRHNNYDDLKKYLSKTIDNVIKHIMSYSN